MILKEKNFNFIVKNLDIEIILILLIFQVFFWTKTEQIKPNLGLVPEVPTISTIKAFSFGDEEFFFRYKGLRIQNSGDTYGRFSPLKDYDYSKLYEWFILLDTLDSESNYVPSMAAYYYSMTQNKKDTIYIINYLEKHTDNYYSKQHKKLQAKWWWYYQAMFLADKVYKNKDIAIRIATKMKNNSQKNAPLWTKQMLPLLLSDKGEKCEALKIINSILKEYENENISATEINYMKFFIKQKIEEIKKERFDFRKCL